MSSDGVFRLQAHLLRGTMYTLLSKVDEAMADLEQVIDAGDDDKFAKVSPQHTSLLDPFSSRIPAKIYYQMQKVFLLFYN